MSFPSLDDLDALYKKGNQESHIAGLLLVYEAGANAAVAAFEAPVVSETPAPVTQSAEVVPQPVVSVTSSADTAPEATGLPIPEVPQAPEVGIPASTEQPTDATQPTDQTA